MNDIISSRGNFSKRKLFLQGGNIHCKSGLMLSTDARPRLKWTAELHEHFIEAVDQLGGPDKATPKTVMGLMGIPGLTLYHLKSHLQKYRLSENLRSRSTASPTKDVVRCNSAVDTKYNVVETTNGDLRIEANKSKQINEALLMQLEVQRQLNEQLEVQRRLQIRMEAQGKYLQSVLQNAQETLEKQNLGLPSLETAEIRFSELVATVTNGSPTKQTFDANENASLQREFSYLPVYSRNPRLKDPSIFSDQMQNDRSGDYNSFGQLNSKRQTQLNSDGDTCSKAPYLDLNAYDANNSGPGCKKFDLNGF